VCAGPFGYKGGSPSWTSSFVLWVTDGGPPFCRQRSASEVLYQLFDSLYDTVKGLWKDQSMLELQPR